MVYYSTSNLEDLEAWQKSIDLAVSINSISKYFRKDEQFSLTNQKLFNALIKTTREKYEIK